MARLRGDLTVGAAGLRDLINGDDTAEAEAAAVEVMAVLSLARQFLTRK